MLVQAVVGGTAAFFGPVLGAGFLTVLPELVREAGGRLGLAPGPLRMGLDGVVLLLVILWLPNGLASLPSRLRGRARRAP
jgi:branched-chain amino acid transport system permease protein